MPDPRAHKQHRQSRRYPISLVMIVRDEARVLARCLESVKELVDEIVVVDTGSVDDSVAIAESYGAEVRHFRWIDDFAAARNFALDQASHPWRLVLDADEWIVDRTGAAEAFDRVTALKPDFAGQIEMVQLDEKSGALRDTAAFPLPRLLPAGLRYAGRVHEQIPRGTPLRPLGVLVGHDGYTPEALARKDGRNIALLEAALADDPSNAYLWYQLGADNFANARPESALLYFIQAYNLLHPESGAAPCPEPWWHLVTVRLLMTLRQVGRCEDAVALGEREADKWSDSADFFFVFGDIVWTRSRQVVETDLALADELTAAAIGCWLRAVELEDLPHYSGCLNERGTVLAARALGEVYGYLGRTADAERYATLGAGAVLV